MLAAMPIGAALVPELARGAGCVPVFNDEKDIDRAMAAIASI
jgi:hypothetical protein